MSRTNAPIHRRLQPGLLATVMLVLACGPTRASEVPEATPAAAPDAAQVELAKRLAYLEAKLEQARIDAHVPGMAIAIVKDDQLIYAKGFGVSDLDANTPVTPDTVFAIGSSTKAFSSTLIAMLVDEGKMDWDDPVTRHLPDFELKIDTEGEGAGEGEVVTIRDLLAHRTGFARMGVLWAANTISRAQVLAYASRAEPVAPFRAEFHYNNVTYMAAAEASAKAAGSSWEHMVEARLLGPLSMAHTSVDYAGAQGDPALSRGYTWREDLEAFEPAPMRNLFAIAPAGSINSSVVDMANWLRLQLGEGEFEGQRLVSEAALAQTKTAQIEVAPGTIDYGMGWMLREWQGRRVVEHGGNIDGFAAAVAMLPDQELGVVILTNVGMTPLQASGAGLVWKALLTDAYLADENQDQDQGQAELSRFVGSYVNELPGFGGEPFEVLLQGDKLAVDVPGQTVYELKAPDDDGWRYFELTDEVAISFDEDDNGQIIALRLHQGGMDMELLREGVELEPEVDASEVRPYLGHYSSDVGLTAQVLIHNGHLAVDIPGQMTFDLELPDAQGDYHLRVNYDMFVTFKKGKDKKADEIVGMTMFQKGKPVTFERQAGGEARTITAEQLHKKRKTDRRKKALQKAGVVRFEQVIEMPSAGVTGTSELWFDPEGHLRQDTQLGDVGRSLLLLHDGGGWSESSFEPDKALDGVRLIQAALGHPQVMFGDWRDYYESETVVRTEAGDGGNVHVVELRHSSLPLTTMHVDAKSGDVIEIHAREVMASGLSVPVTLTLSDYRKVGGMRLPHRIESSNPHTGTTVVILKQVETKQAVDEGRFELPDSAHDQ